MGRNLHQRFDCANGCAVEATLSLIGGKYKGTILYSLLLTPSLRFSELQKILPDVSQRTLTAQLRALEKVGIVHREVYPEVPPKVEYSLTDYGKSLTDILMALKNWGDTHLIHTPSNHDN